MRVYIRHYTDVNGEQRIARLMRQGNNFVQWHMTLPASITSLWQLEDESIVQIPDNAWESVSYEDELKEEGQ